MGLLDIFRKKAPPADRGHQQGEPAPWLGRRQIDQALTRLYPAEREHRFGINPEPGEDEAPLLEIVAYRASSRVPHWHYVTYGLSELGEKTSNDPSLSGFGVEYTLHLVEDAAEPPVWPMNLLRWVAKLVWQTREPLDPGHSMNIPEGLLDTVSPGIEGLGFAKDADLGTIQTPNGNVTFVNVIPLMHREHWLLGAWDFDRYVGVVRSQQGDLLWRVGRSSVLEGKLGQDLLAQVERDGSSQSVDFTALAWTEHELVLDEFSRDVVIKFLRYRLAYGRDAAIIDGDRRASFLPGNWQMKCLHDACTLSIPQGEASSLADDLTAAKHGAIVTRPGATRFRVSVPHRDVSK
jgi:hypothetical protein